MHNIILTFLILVTALTLNAQKLDHKTKLKFLALGDSYTVGQSVDVSGRWPVQLIDSLRQRGYTCYNPKIIAATGWRTDDLKKAISAAQLSNEYNLVSLLIGVNNYYQGFSATQYKPEFEELLNIAITLAGGDKSKVFVVSIPDYGFTPFGKSNQVTISKGIDIFNTTNKAIALKSGVRYIGITDISRMGLKEPDLIAVDGLHPSAKMYSKWVSRMLEEFL